MSRYRRFWAAWRSPPALPCSSWERGRLEVNDMTLRFLNPSRALHLASLILLSLVFGIAAGAQTPTPSPQFNLRLSTSRGCIETGQNPVFRIGEPLTISLRVGSNSVFTANATLF